MSYPPPYNPHNAPPHPAPAPYAPGPVQNVQSTNMNTNVVNVQVGAPVVRQVEFVPVAKPPDYLCLACLVCWCCNSPVGLVAVILSCISRSEADDGDMDQARKMGKASMWTSIGGIVTSVLIIVIIIIVAVSSG